MAVRILAVIVALFSVVLTAGCAAPEGFSTPHRLATHYGDKRLYRDIAARVAGGQSYYQAASAQQRAHRYPLKPAFTVRPPTLVWAAAAFGWEALRLAAYGLLIVAGLTWFFAVRSRASTIEGIGAGLVCIGTGWALLGGSNPVILHERWAGMFITLALALRLNRRTGWSIAADACAMAVRELAAPFALLALASAVVKRQRREAVGWCALLMLYAVLLAWHWHVVALHTLPNDLVSQGWGGSFRPMGALGAIVATSPLQWVPLWLAIPLTVLAPLGWLALGRRDGLFCLVLYCGLALMIALFARPDNFYWGAIVQPGWFIGLALLPRAALMLSRRLRGLRRPFASLASTEAAL